MRSRSERELSHILIEGTKLGKDLHGEEVTPPARSQQATSPPATMNHIKTFVILCYGAVLVVYGYSVYGCLHETI